MLRYKAAWLVIFLMFTAWCAHATEQENDLFLYGGQNGELQLSYTFPSPLEVYFADAYPFPGLSTANYRGHVATWEVQDGALYLTNVRVREVDVPLEWLFGGVPHNADKVPATWFSGMLLTHFGPYKEWHSNPNYPGNYYIVKYAAVVIFEVKDGRVVTECVFTNDEYERALASAKKNGVSVSVEQANAIRKYQEYVRSFAEETTPLVRQTPPPSGTPLAQLIDILAAPPYRGDES